MGERIEKEDDKIKHLEDLYSEHGGILTRNSQLFCYGILIGLFHFGRDFFKIYKAWALTTASFSIASLLLIYMYSVLVFLLAKNGLELKNALSKKNQLCSEDCIKYVIELSYRKKRQPIMFVFWLFQITLIFSVFLFIISAYLHFYGWCA